MAGGPRETAGSTAPITRRRENGELPLPGAALDSTGQFSTAELEMREILDGKNPAANIEIKPNDVISVSQGNARMVYVVGDVQRSGAFNVGGQRTISVLSAVSLAGAALDSTGQFSTAELEMREILDGRYPAANIEIKPNDVISVSQGNARMVYVLGDV